MYITTVRVYAVIIAILCECLRASLVVPTSLQSILWLVQVHWAVTTPLMVATLVPSISIAAIFGIITCVLALIFTVLTGLSIAVVSRCGFSCISTFPYDVARISGLALVSLFSALLSFNWSRIEPPRYSKRTHLFLILLGIIPSGVLLFSTRRIFSLPAFAIDPTLIWITLKDRTVTQTIALGAILLLVGFDILHLILFADSDYLYNILILRTILDVGRLYIRFKSI